MTGFKDEDILNRHIRGLNGDKLFKMRQVKPLTPRELRLLLNRFDFFNTDEKRVDLFAAQFNKLAKHMRYCCDLFRSIDLSHLTNEEFLGLCIIYYGNANPEYTMFETVRKSHSDTDGDRETFFIMLHIFYAIWVEPLFRPEFKKDECNSEIVALYLEKALTELFLLMEEKAFEIRLAIEKESRLKKSPICYNLYKFIQETRRGKKSSGRYYESLLNMCKKKVKDLFLPYYVEYDYLEKKAQKKRMVR